MIIEEWEHSKTLEVANGRGEMAVDGVGKGRRGRKIVYRAFTLEYLS